jgi:hypothetical protein
MFRTLIGGTALSTIIAVSAPGSVLAQPPSPPEIVHKVDRGVRHIVTEVDRKIRHAGRRTHHVVRHNVYRTTHHRVRALCNDGRFHTGRTGLTACAGHGGIR